ncbi:low-density lipoprotein receptor-related protein 12-like [Lytechinus variegatus]|uniref:low-density lipoprotein receptor-related protein 12-like n=1 Tax=Lytechinus variegatus TaxID=7654 RepID=UPI001BB10E5E|nr:low-density lipoprotein receptor-related protein 12-like [Lytechinus variegatus]
MPSETCGYTVDLGDQYKVTSRGTGQGQPPPEITSSDDGAVTYVPSYDDNVDCQIHFRTSGNKTFFIRITHFNLELSNQCENDALVMYDGASSSDDLELAKKCGETLSLPNYFYSRGPDLTVRFKTNNLNNSFTGFVMLITPYWLPGEGENCTEDEIACKLSGKCFTKDAYCNNLNQCEDSSDEPGLTVCSSASRLCGSKIIGFMLALFITYIFSATTHVTNRPRHRSTVDHTI